MSNRVFMKGTEAVAEAAIRAGCRFFAGYPITPQNEVPEYFARKMPEVNGIFLQGESEVASANMLYGGAASGTRSMTSSASCGISLMSEAVSWLALSNLPAVICNFQRGGPGIGSIQPAQQDYIQATKAMGNGGFQMIVLAPNSVQEAADMTYEAFDLADKYLHPVVVLLDGFLGTMMEPVTFMPRKSEEEIAEIKANKTWVPNGNKTGFHRVFMRHLGDVQLCNQEAADMYKGWKETETSYETYLTEDAELIITAYGIASRICQSVVDRMRKEGYKVGMLRPKRLNPFPEEAFENLSYEKLKGILSVEMSIPEQYGVDVKIAVANRCKLDYCLSSGGTILDAEDIYQKALAFFE